MATQHKEEDNRFVGFTLAGDTYAININDVSEIIIMPSITRIPGLSGIFEGIINLRDRIVPVYNIKKKGSCSRESTSFMVVVVKVGGRTLGITVDGITEVLKIPASAMEKPPFLISENISADYIKAVARLEENLVIILNLAALPSFRMLG